MATIHDTIEYYKKNIDKYWEGEKYKWIAFKHFRENWNIDSDNFSQMVEESFSKANNLLTGSMYYPYRMICRFAELYPEKIKNLFIALYDENRPLADRFGIFRDGCAELLKDYSINRPKAKSHYQDIRALCVYLSFMYPDKYYLYKPRMYKDYIETVEYSESSQNEDLGTRKYENFADLCQLIINEASEDPELIAMQKERENSLEDCFKDESLHLLAQTIIYVWTKKYGDASINSPENEEEYIPSGAQDSVVGENDELIMRNENMNKSGIGLNTILYGPPGTGKTYHVAHYAVAICDNIPIGEILKWKEEDVRARYDSLKEQDRISFTTFHQSYGYEEFIEGIRPVMENDASEDSDSTTKELVYKIESGIFKKFCDKARNSYVSETNADWGLNDNPTVWKVSLEGTGDNKTRSECMKNNHIRIGWGEYGPDITRESSYAHGGRVVLNAFYNKMKKGDIVVSCYSSELTDAIGVITGDAEWDDSYPTYKRVRNVKWLVKDIRENIIKLNDNKPMVLASVYKLDVSSEDVLNIVKKYLDSPEKATKKKNYVFVIDEINRGNISKVFGELITLIETTKREGAKEETRVRLPYSGQLFGVPDNVFILGTMNTADRSIALMDTALRRRFQFVEMMPNLNVIDGLIVSDGEMSLDVSKMLGIINKRIEFLYDREHTIGHAFFTTLIDMRTPRISDLGLIFKKAIIPLLQEYFYEDYEKIRLVLGDNAKNDKSIEFIVAESPEDDLFSGNVTDEDYRDYVYNINERAFFDIRSYKGISDKL